MYKKVILYVLFYGFILFGLRTVSSTLLSLSTTFFGFTDLRMAQIPLDILFSYLAGYLCFNHLIKTQKTVVDPFFIGVTVGLIPWFFGALTLYLLSNELAFDGIFYMLICGLGAKTAFKNQNLKINRVLKILFFGMLLIFVILISLFTINSIINKSSIQNTLTQNGLQVYEDKKFGYSFSYPKEWKIKHYPLAPGYVEIISNKDPNTLIYFWYKDSEPIKNRTDFKNFIQSEIQYGESVQKIKTTSTEEIEVNNIKAIVWTSYDPSDGSYVKSYYFPDYEPTDGQNIHVWVAGVITKGKDMPNENEIVNNILNSIKIDLIN